MAASTETCKQTPGAFAPVIDMRRCEGKADCVRVCPHDVFAVRTLTAEERGALSFLTRVKVAVHGGRQAFVVNAGQCEACGLCVAACPEHAITLARNQPL